jgi:hypothetical protein
MRNGRFWNGCYGAGRGGRSLGRGQLNSSGHAISVAVMPQWTLEHRVFTYDSFLKKKWWIDYWNSSVSLPFHPTFQCAIFFSVVLPQVTFIRRKATNIRRTERRHSQANRNELTVGASRSKLPGATTNLHSLKCSSFKRHIFSYINRLKWHVIIYHFVIINNLYNKN